MARRSLAWLDDLRATTRDRASAAGFRYCRLRFGAGAFGEKVTWGSVKCLYEVDESGAPTRQLQIYDHAPFTHRFSSDQPFIENFRGERFGGELRTEPLADDEIEQSRITHEEFEHAWLTGFLGTRTVDEYRDALLCEAADEGPQMLWEAWSVAEKWYPYEGASNALSLAERAIEHFVDEGLVELVSIRVNGEGVEEVEACRASHCQELLLARQSWLASVGFRLTERGLEDLRARGRIR